ncbi:Uncharacterized protein APZ42_027233 [Daphnia magna]|uniref:Uncharacterized protein n=1 Tax=Daphnia magna TaxID=35525 RepID=A0A164RDP1_9CRUS|nr:Uncharacterized protein APZ42_027233 [Daphnia magna]
MDAQVNIPVSFKGICATNQLFVALCIFVTCDLICCLFHFACLEVSLMKLSTCGELVTI